MEKPNSFSSSTAHARGAGITPQDALTFTWGTVLVDGFRIDNAVFTLSSDGRNYFQGLVQNEQNNGNTLYISGFGLHDANGLELFRSPQVMLNGGYEDPTQNSVTVLSPSYMYGYITTLVLYS